MPKISCVMPCRDRDKIIGESIKTIINQTFNDWELIIVDDHSSSEDNTGEVIKSFNDNRIKYFRLEDENGIGISAARNFGNIVATGEIIAIADSDDIYDPKRFELTANAFEENDCDLVYGDIKAWNPETGEIGDRGVEYKVRKFDLNHFKEYDYIPHPTVAFKRQIGLDFPYNSFFRRAEDYDFLARLVQHGFKFYFIDHPLVKYRQHKSSITHEKLLKFNYSEIARKNRGWKVEK
ncbi:MAG: family 2 glycosyl transferase [Candidatus Berkelbacteria bacterium Athens1014_28]|uniref:Family 2 glycosyl transferase n=1 Tax=Candidatus Berkelbacteria bacterium Athens1014_28 TaxID=2017145 RepID=A0A554LLF2_9BACT|nr:MAG: family 2 glycosyl transferase [Candidatus Berkelbacteria bacterium Athens1014_28]